MTLPYIAQKKHTIYNTDAPTHQHWPIRNFLITIKIFANAPTNNTNGMTSHMVRVIKCRIIPNFIFQCLPFVCVYFFYLIFKGPFTTTFFYLPREEFKDCFSCGSVWTGPSSPSLGFSRCVSTISDVFARPGSVFRILFSLVKPIWLLSESKNLKNQFSCRFLSNRLVRVIQEHSKTLPGTLKKFMKSKPIKWNQIQNRPVLLRPIRKKIFFNFTTREMKKSL